jgi:hypothetical protein
MWDLNPRGLSTTDLAGLPPTRLGQSRQIFASTPQVFAGVQSCFGLLFNPMLSGLFAFSKKKIMFLLLTC